jgi:CAAX protease family protein
MSEEKAFWSYEDLMLFLGSTLPAYLIALVSIRPFHFPSAGVQQVVFQGVFYTLLLTVLYFLIVRYRNPFWRSLGWTFSFKRAWLCVLAGPMLAFGLAALAAALHAPAETMIENLVSDKSSRVVVALFVMLLGPLFEELVFRGFLLPLFEKSLGAVAAIALSSIPFALLHGTTVRWSWQSMLVIGLAGVTFGIARVRTGSTTAAAIVHVGYNSTLFSFFLLQKLT